MKAIAAFVVRRRWWVIGSWIIAFALLAPAARRLERTLEVAATVHGSEASAVDELLASRFASPFARFAVLVVTGGPPPGTEAGTTLLATLDSSLATLRGVSGTMSYLTARDTLLVGAQGAGTLILIGFEPSAGRPDALLPSLRAATRTLEARLRTTMPSMTLRWTGEVPINADIRAASAADARGAEQRVLPLTLILLVLACGTVVAAVLPIVTASIAIIITLGIATFVNAVTPLSVVLQNIVSMIGLGVGVDYALLTVSRFREALASGRSTDDAATEASEHAGVTIALSAAAVMIGFGALLVVPLNELQSVGAGGIIVVGVSAVAAITLLPAILAALGRHVDAGRLGRRTAASSPLESWWRAWGRWVVARPRLVLILGIVPVLLLASQASRISTELPRGNWLPRGMESALALDDLARMGRDGVVNTIRVVVELPAGADALDDVTWQAMRRLSAAIGADDRVARAQSLVSVMPFEHPNAMLFSLLPPTVLSTLVSRDGRALALDVVPRSAIDANRLTALARDLRRLDAPAVTKLPGIALRVGGLPAFNADYTDAIDRRFVGIVALVVGLTLVALMIGFRSILVPVKALVLNLLSVAAAYGAVVLVFQDGYFVWLVGMDAATGAVFPAVPILVFCTVFGLSMDYEVFLVARIAEARARLDDREAIVEGLARTGGVITSAAAIMITVFAAFTIGDFLFIKVLGFALAVAVFVDATIVRMAIGPALLALAGRWNWWPGDRRPAGTPTGEELIDRVS